MRLISSPLYALATNNASKNVPAMRPWPLEHFRTKAAKHRLENSSLMYDPSVTATKEPSEIDSQSHDTLSVTCRCSHSQVFPQE
jgi:hypothetical protein